MQQIPIEETAQVLANADRVGKEFFRLGQAAEVAAVVEFLVDGSVGCDADPAYTAKLVLALVSGVHRRYAEAKRMGAAQAMEQGLADAISKGKAIGDAVAAGKVPREVEAAIAADIVAEAKRQAGPVAQEPSEVAVERMTDILLRHLTLEDNGLYVFDADMTVEELARKMVRAMCDVGMTPREPTESAVTHCENCGATDGEGCGQCPPRAKPDSALGEQP